MSLQVWLPLNGDLHNQGLGNYSISLLRGTQAFDEMGKIGQCFNANGVNTIQINNIIPDFYNYSGYSLCAWFYINAQNTSHSGSAIISAGNWNKQILNLALSGWSSDHYTQLQVSGTSWNKIYNYNFNKNTWYHVVVSSDGNKTYAYVNGFLIGDTLAGFLPSSIEGNNIAIGGATYYSGMQFFGKINDVRIYNHCLSAKEVEEISKGLVLHLPLNRKDFNYNLNVGKNLLIGSGLTQTDYNNMTVSNSSTNWTKYLRWYNGSKAIHSFSDGVDTILLNTTGNLGICFVQKASEIDLDPNSYYTLSCEAKCSKSGAQISMARSYYNTSNTWVWRGGSDKQNFNAVNTWQNFSITFKPDANTQYICYCFTCANGTSGGTDTFSIRHCKLEKGSIATPWELNISEDLYETTNITQLNTCYDISGYSKNGTVIGNISFLKNSPCFSTYINLTTTSSHIYIPNLNVTGFTNSYSISWWGKVSSYSGKMMWGFSDGCRLNGIYNGNLWNTGDSSNNPLYKPGTTTQVSIPSVNVWHHFVMVGNGSQCLVYQDGELWGQAKTYKSLTGTQIYMNGWNNSTSYTLADTQLSDFRIYATVLTENQVKELYNTSVIINNNERISRNL